MYPELFFLVGPDAFFLEEGFQLGVFVFVVEFGVGTHLDGVDTGEAVSEEFVSKRDFVDVNESEKALVGVQTAGD